MERRRIGKVERQEHLRNGDKKVIKTESSAKFRDVNGRLDSESVNTES